MVIWFKKPRITQCKPKDQLHTSRPTEKLLKQTKTPQKHSKHWKIYPKPPSSSLTRIIRSSPSALSRQSCYLLTSKLAFVWLFCGQITVQWTKPTFIVFLCLDSDDENSQVCFVLVLLLLLPSFGCLVTRALIFILTFVLQRSKVCRRKLLIKWNW